MECGDSSPLSFDTGPQNRLTPTCRRRPVRQSATRRRSHGRNEPSAPAGTNHTSPGQTLHESPRWRKVVRGAEEHLKKMGLAI